MANIRIHDPTPNQINQQFQDVFNAFFKLEELLKSPSPHTKNYVTVRLVTIIEQFCRLIIEEQLKKGKGKLQSIIKINPQSIDKMQEITTEKLIASSEHFQNIQSLKNLKEYDMKDIFNPDDLKKLEELFLERHDVVHTVIDTDYNIQTGYDITAELIKQILLKSIFKNESMFYFAQGYSLGNLGKYEEAIVCCDKAIEIDPDNVAAYHNKGIDLDSLGKYEEAIVCCDKAIEITLIILIHTTTKVTV